MTSPATLLLLAATLAAPEPIVKPAAPATIEQVGEPEVATPEVATPEVATPEVATPEVATPEVATPEVATPEVAPAAPAAPAATPAPATTAGGTVDPLYERLFGRAPAATRTERGASLPALPAWAWLASAAGLAGLYLWRQRRRGEPTGPGQVAILGNTRVGPKARLTVVRVAGADGRARRLLLSTGDGAPTLVADLGTEGDGAEAAPTASPAFAQVLDGALHTLPATVQVDEEPEADPTQDEAGTGVVPPPRVPVWNETPDEYRSAHRPPTPGLPPQAPPAPDPLARLAALLDDGEAPELALDLRWDTERGWQGVSAHPTAANARPTPPRPQDSEPAEIADTEEPGPIPAPSEASRVAFQALLGGAAASPPPSPRRAPTAPLEARVVRPMRPWQVAPARRTPYDAVQAKDPPAGSALPRTSAEVQNLVAEVLQERKEVPPARSARVVDLAGWVRRQVQR